MGNSVQFGSGQNTSVAVVTGGGNGIQSLAVFIKDKTL